jgi:hypothetical protein
VSAELLFGLKRPDLLVCHAIFLRSLFVKKSALTFVFVYLAAAYLAGSCVYAEPDDDIEVASDPVQESDTESVTVTVTRSREGVVVVTADGRRVLLRDDHTWEVVEAEQGDPATSAVISVANVRGLRNACKIGLRLDNNLGYNIKSLIPSFSAYTRDGVLYETVSKAFSSIKPTRDQYQQIQFIGITCDDIGYVRVHGAEHCSMGLMDKFNEEDGECLGHIHVVGNEQMKVTK